MTLFPVRHYESWKNQLIFDNVDTQEIYNITYE
jgi:hypothetical protein